MTRPEEAVPVADPVDLRLAVGAAASWLTMAALLHRNPSTALIAAGTAAVFGTATLALARHRTFAPAAALVLFCCALVLLPLAARSAHARASPLFRLAGRHAAVSLTVTVTDDPRTLAARGASGAPRVAVETAADAVDYRGHRLPAGSAVLILGAAAPWRDVLPGQQVEVEGTLQPALDGGALSVTLFERGPPRSVGRPPWWQRGAGAVRGALRRSAAVLPHQERGLLPGLIDGDTANLDPVLAERFRRAGLTHLVAVSGTNCSIVVGVALLALRRLRVRRSVSAAVGLLVLALFVVIARPSPSVLRAALMGAVALGAFAVGRPRAGVPILAACVLVLLLWDPTLALSASFAMSVFATFALLIIAPGWAYRLRRHGVPPGLAEAIAVATAAHLVTAPVVAAISGQISLVAVPANVLAEPVVAVTTVLGFAAAVVAPIWLPMGQGLAWVAGWPCRWLVGVADFFGGLHDATVPWPGGTAGGVTLLVLVLVLCFAAVRSGTRRVLAATAATVLVLLIPVHSITSGWPPTGWVFAACDVGQGDALLLSAGPSSAVEIDAGPDPVAIDRCLSDFGITRIPLLVLTHDHLDHVGGLPGVIRGRRVDRIITGPLAEPRSGVEIVARAAAATNDPVLTPPVGTSLDVGGVHLDVLGPAAALHGTRSDPNNSSLILRAEVGGVRILLPGDAEVEEQQAVLNSGVDLRADVLKVPHHGSAYSDPAFLAAVRARVAVVSVGAHNDYGHPSPVLLGELARLGVPLLRTDRDGDVAITSHAGRVEAVVHGAGQSRLAAGRGIRAGTAVTAAREWSVPGGRMTVCRRDRSASTHCRSRYRPSSCSSAMRSTSSAMPSARSPPPPGAPIRTWSNRWSRVVRSTVRNCTDCLLRRCSATPGCSSSGRCTTSASLRLLR